MSSCVKTQRLRKAILNTKPFSLNRRDLSQNSVQEAFKPRRRENSLRSSVEIVLKLYRFYTKIRYANELTFLNTSEEYLTPTLRYQALEFIRTNVWRTVEIGYKEDINLQQITGKHTFSKVFSKKRTTKLYLLSCCLVVLYERVNTSSC